jgi:hypothetical protein
VGYEINKRQVFKRHFRESTLIGGFNMCFRKRYLFVMKTSQKIEGYAIRRSKWQ